MRADIIILNSKERKHLRQQLEENFGIGELPEEYVYFCINKKERLYVAKRELFEQDLQALRVNAFGLYIGTFMKDGFRFSLEGAQLFGPLATKHIIHLDSKNRNNWFKGEDIDLGESEHESQYVLVKSGDDFLGSGKVKEGIIMNYLAKARKLTNVFEP